MQSFLILIDTVLSLYMWCIIIAAVMSWLTYGNVINTHNRFVYMIGDFLYRITEPVLRIFRRWIPNLGGIDVSPVVVILLIVLIRNLLREYGSGI
ncbi:MAG: YggT family protein [Rhodospirillaceae bacterium]|nr:YggT family protein [Rhodospirillaceae bacterium]